MNIRETVVQTIAALKPCTQPGPHTVKNLQLHVRSAEARLNQLLRQLDTPVEEVACANCDYVGKANDHVQTEISDFHERVDSGETVPYGQCPKCGALLYEKDIE